jgi:cysteinyl-tRNA synthetase
VLEVTNTLTRAKEPVRPGTPGRVTMYSCGPTVYRSAHIGNLRTFLLADLVRRALEAGGTEVRQVQNITDVGHMTNEELDRGEDRMLVSARLEGRTPAEIADHYTRAFLADAAALNLQPAAEYPRASDYIPQMQELVAKLLEAGNAYEAEGNLYFAVESFPGYGRLSGNTLDQLRAGHRQEEPDPRKRHHADFALWKAAGPGRLVKWPSPWGDGYPGWHIECSAMSLATLGEQIDVHTGGEDNVFPHHEDEIAQSEAVVGHQVVTTWVHGAHLLTGDAKMAKSRGNVATLADLTARGQEPLAARLLFLQARYGSQLDFNWDTLAGAGRTLQRLRSRMADWARDPGDGRAPGCPDAEREFWAAVEDDLDTPRALTVLHRLQSDDSRPPADRFAALQSFDRLLGLDLAAEVGQALPAGARELIDARERARAARDFAAADRLRDQLAALGVEVTDTRAGTTWRLRP